MTSINDSEKSKQAESSQVQQQEEPPGQKRGRGVGRFDDLDQDEIKALRETRHNALWYALANFYATAGVFVFYLISIESLVSIALSVFATVYTYQVADDDFGATSLNWTLLSFAVITPMSAAISMAFNRREQALRSIGRIRATGLELYLSHARWDWGWKMNDKGEVISSGRSRSAVDWLQHSDQVLETLLHLFCDLTRYLTLPTASRARHKITRTGRREADQILHVSAGLYELMMERFDKLAVLCEIMKQEGLPPNEATRQRQWERFILEEIETIRMIKRYRTPQGLRSFGRLFSIFLPAFYGPYYASLAKNMNSLGFAIAFAVVTSMALTSLFETISQMEDPFLGTSAGLDGINVSQELEYNFRPRILRMRKSAFPEAPPYKDEATDSTLLRLKERDCYSKARILNE